MREVGYGKNSHKFDATKGISIVLCFKSCQIYSDLCLSGAIIQDCWPTITRETNLCRSNRGAVFNGLSRQNIQGSNRQGYVVPPLEGLWWADDLSAFTSNHRESWKWTLLSFLPEWVSEEHIQVTITKAVFKRVQLAQQIQVLELSEESSYQVFHIGSIKDEGPILDYLHHTVMPLNNATFNGPHHEIYLSDFRKTEPSKRRTILRQLFKELSSN